MTKPYNPTEELKKAGEKVRKEQKKDAAQEGGDGGDKVHSTR